VDKPDGEAAVLKTALHGAHLASGARMAHVAGYDMPVEYLPGAAAEQAWARTHAGLQDISHKGQCFLIALDGSHETVSRALEALVRANILELALGQHCAAPLVDRAGDVPDIVTVTRHADPANAGALLLVIGAEHKELRCTQMVALLPSGVVLKRRDTQALLALRGPQAAAVLGELAPGADLMPVMSSHDMMIAGVPCSVSRSANRGPDDSGIQDEFVISVINDEAGRIWGALLADDRVKPIGLGA
jgi:aminomethyltransferase